MRHAVVVGALAVLAGLIEPSAALAQRPTCGPFRVEWDRGVLSPTSEKLDGNLGPGGRGYFALPLPLPSAVEYRVNVVSFDEVMSPQAP